MTRIEPRRREVAKKTRQKSPCDYPVNPQTFGQHIRKRRIDFALSQRRLANNLGIHFHTIRNWEDNRTKPTRRHLPQVREFLGYDPCPEPANTGERIKEYRRIRRLSQRELAKRLGVELSTIGHWENGHHQPSRQSIERLRHILAIA